VSSGSKFLPGWTIARNSLDSCPIFFFGENELFNHLPLLEPLSDAEKAYLKTKIVRRHFQAGEQLLTQGMTIESVQFVFSGVIQVARQINDGRVLNARRLGPGDSVGEISLLTGMHSNGTLTALTSGLLLGLCSEDFKPVLQSRPELIELLSYSVARQLQYIAMFDQAAVQPVVIEQRDLLSRIRNFFRLSVEDRALTLNGCTADSRRAWRRNHRLYCSTFTM
jgi:CRP-like cAMP-binding protein